MKIVDVDIKELNRASRRFRARSSETNQLVDAISVLKPGQAKAVVVENEGAAKKMRSRLIYAAGIAGKRLQIANVGDRVMFALSNRPPRARK